MHAVFDLELWAALLTLTALEIVLGIDNIIFLSIMANKLPEAQRARARTWGLAGALITRVLLLMSLAWVARLTQPLFEVLQYSVSGRDLILFGGGLFLIAKSTLEIHHHVESGTGPESSEGAPITTAAVSFVSVIVQIMLLDIIFSLDSVITAVGMTDRLGVMITAIVIAIGVMMFFAGAVSRFVERHPTIKVLALAFLILIGMALTAEGLGFHVPKGYIYFAMAFSIGVEAINMRARAKQRVRV
ncbi:TerC family protein [Sinimarinibacterium sp. CAU 1509]|uniref:TerC family protein n=1 Tax=Sinimarinibacterium sp. CAU 1509 TaxID=2562283 RepID=UPI0010AD72A6|nr:TerC family protein [Sinimarinibacterium sp. CAU 1509]TJY55166.1 TerC family protein [Sinimarinibacterium sp. CAU 1509]